MSSESNEERAVFTRGGIENLCLLSAIPDEGCAIGDLSVLLGLSPHLKESVAEAIGPLIETGWVQESDDRVAVSSAGRAWLSEQLSRIA